MPQNGGTSVSPVHTERTGEKHATERCLAAILHHMWSTLCLILAIAAAQDSPSKTISVFDEVAIELDRELAESTERGAYVIRRDGRTIERTIELPAAPADQRDAMRILATLHVEPRLTETERGVRPGDPWPRLGSVTVVDGEQEVEIMRFITAFGASATYRADLTALAPLLHGEQTLRIFISTYMNPAWSANFTLEYAETAGQRRPIFAEGVFLEEQVTSDSNILRAKVNIPEGLDRPRLRILSTGHATDGRGGDEFISRTHILRINGEEIARWRPWAERGGSLRDRNPASGRRLIDGRELWSSDLDRSGWHPGAIVWPLIIPLPELAPGENEMEIEIEDIRPRDSDDPQGEHGYWRVSATVVADEPWPPPPHQQGGDSQ